MKKTLTGFAIVLVAALWMTGSWAFFNSIANGAEGAPTTPPAPAENQAQPTAPPTHEHHWKGRHFHADLWKKLNLSEAQKKEIKAIREQERPEMRPLIKELKDAHKRLVDLRKTGRFDVVKVRAIAEEQAKTLTNVIVDRERTLYKIRAVLTPEQRTKLDQMRESWKTNHKHCEKCDHQED